MAERKERTDLQILNTDLTRAANHALGWRPEGKVGLRIRRNMDGSRVGEFDVPARIPDGEGGSDDVRLTVAENSAPGFRGWINRTRKYTIGIRDAGTQDGVTEERLHLYPDQPPFVEVFNGTSDVRSAEPTDFQRFQGLIAQSRNRRDVTRRP